MFININKCSELITTNKSVFGYVFSHFIWLKPLLFYLVHWVTSMLQSALNHFSITFEIVLRQLLLLFINRKYKHFKKAAYSCSMGKKQQLISIVMPNKRNELEHLFHFIEFYFIPALKCHQFYSLHNDVHIYLLLSQSHLVFYFILLTKEEKS